MQNDTYTEGILSYCFRQWEDSIRQRIARLLKEYIIMNAHFVYNRSIMVDTKENDYWTCHNCHHTHGYIDKLHAFITTKCTRQGNQEEKTSKQIII